MDVATQIAAPSVTAGMIEFGSDGPRMPIRIAMAMSASPDSGDQSVRPVVWATTRLASHSQAIPATLTSAPPDIFAAAKKSTAPTAVPMEITEKLTSSWRPPSLPLRRLPRAALSAGSAIKMPATAPPRIMPMPTLFAVKLRNELASTSPAAWFSALPSNSAKPPNSAGTQPRSTQTGIKTQKLSSVPYRIARPGRPAMNPAPRLRRLAANTSRNPAGKWIHSPT